MGVRFLESYLEKESRKACYQVDIPRIVHEYRRTTNQIPVIVVDGMSCLRPLYGNLSWLNGGQYKEFYEIIHKFINNFTNLGCELVVYFDGPVQNIKLPVWKKRRLQSADEISAIFDQLHRGSKYIESNCRSSCLPNGLGSLFLFLLSQHKNCRILKSLRECDEEIAQYAYRNKCFAILGQDTDFVIYRGAMYYLSIKHLNLDSMTTLCYDGFNLSVELGIHIDCLPLLASLLGNDIIEFESLKYFHQTLKRRSHLRNSILLVAEFIRSLRNIDLSQIASFVFGDIEKVELLQKSISSYDLHSISSDVGKEADSSNFSSWEKIIHFGKEKFIKSFQTAPLYDILFLCRFHSSTCLEDYRPHNIIVPIGELLKDLRRSIYGVLLHEKPSVEGNRPVVSELVMTGFNSMDDFVRVQPKYLQQVKHPGLIALWTSKEKQIEDVRWQILCEVFKVDLAALRHIPPWYIVPAFAARYFKEQFSNVADWEINAFISSSVCVKHYSAQDLARLPSDPLTYRQIWMYTALSRSFSTVNNLIFYIGEPISFEHTLPYQYTDGKLFHEKYRQSSNNSSIESLCEHQVENLEMFNLLKSFIMA